MAVDDGVWGESSASAAGGSDLPGLEDATTVAAAAASGCCWTEEDVDVVGGAATAVPRVGLFCVSHKIQESAMSVNVPFQAGRVCSRKRNHKTTLTTPFAFLPLMVPSPLVNFFMTSSSGLQ